METRHPVEGQFGSEFRAICNHCGVMEAWSRKTWKFCKQFLRFFKNDPYGKIFKILFRKFSPPHRSKLLCSNVIKCIRREIGEIVRYLPDKKQKCRLPSKLSLLRGSRPKSAREAPTMCSQCFRFHTNPFNFGRVIAERVNIVFCHVKCSHDSPEA